MIKVIEDAGARGRRAYARGIEIRRGRNSRRSKELRGLFQSRRDEIDGIIVTLPNFGDERGIADTLRLADLNVPVLVQATPDTPSQDDHPRPPRQLLRQDVGLQ